MEFKIVKMSLKPVKNIKGTYSKTSIVDSVKYTERFIQIESIQDFINLQEKIGYTLSIHTFGSLNIIMINDLD